ncbi:glutathione S-transferase family protein [Paraconexibacter sp. AEG42_29]|uniref:glutathione S-transferase family protein n=1 Tax=Paraconexibacter sp. AEG42_29 TaxID=2997339 RepID=UPI00339D440A
MRLYHRPGSRSTRVLWTLEEIGAPYELTIISREDKASEAHRRRHPLGRVPVLELDDGQHVFESAAICLHLGDLYPESGLVPPVGTAERALTYQWSLFAMAEVEGSLLTLRRARRTGDDDSEPTAKFGQIAGVLREALGDGRPWLVGDAFTVADVLCGSLIGTAFRRDLLDEDGPLRDYAERAQVRPANVRAEAIRE